MTIPPLPPNMQGLGISWFREEDWPRWLAIDPDFQPDYQHWLRRSEEMFQCYQAEGVPIEKVIMDPDEFLTWSRATGKGVDHAARAAYVATKTMRRHTAN